jgi:hypothetical protein
MPLCVTWIGRGVTPAYPPDPAHPRGAHLDLALDAADTCSTELPYPATGAGVYVVQCTTCGMRVVCRTFGRPDDPRSIKLPCRPRRPPLRVAA